MHGNERVPITKREKSLGGYNTRSFYFKEGVWDVRIHSGNELLDHQISIQEGLLLRNPPVVVRAAFQFVSTHPFFLKSFFYLPFPSIPAGDERS